MSPPSGTVDVPDALSPDYADVEEFPSLKQSLSAAVGNGIRPRSPQPDGYFDSQGSGKESPKPTHSTSSLNVDVPYTPSAAEAALAALQYLPTPLLVLSSSKTVILSNEAMGRLLGLEVNGALDTNDDEVGLTVNDKLRGKSLSQIGVDMLQDDQPVWVSWEKLLDGLVDELDQKEIRNQKPEDIESMRGGDETPTATLTSPASTISQPLRQSEKSRKVARQTFVHDTAVNVVLSARHLGLEGVSSKVSGGTSADHQVQANMIISIWELETQRYYTLTFANRSTGTSASTKSQSHVVSRTTTRSSLSPASFPSPASSTEGSTTSPTLTSPMANALSASPFLPLGATNRTTAAIPSVLQKITRMKEAMINAVQLPLFAMWKDESIGFPNKAAAAIMSSHSESKDDSYDLLSKFQVYTENFERQLKPEEYPIIQLCRSEKPFEHWKIGIVDAQNRHLNYDVSGEGIYDPKNGEFLAGLVVLKDVTEYTQRLAAKDEENEQQFQLICDTMPQMLWTATPQGLHDWFSRRWYDYTGLTPEESMGHGWKRPFHPDDIAESGKRWKHCLATGDEYSTEYRCRRHDGVWRWFLGRALPLRNPKTGKITKWFGTATDCHDLVEARQAAKLTKERLLKVISHAQVTVWAIDRNRNITLLEGLLMWEQDERDITPDCVGMNVYDVFGKKAGAADLPLYKGPIEQILGGDAREQISEHHIEGNGKWFRTRFVPVLGKKRVARSEDETYVNGVIGISMNVTELKTRLADLRLKEKQNDKLLSQESAAKEASALKSQFLANMSHEIRTPISGVIGLSELLLDTPLDADQRECSENIQRSANGLLTVINDILDLSKVESGRLDIEEVQFSLSLVISDVSKMLSFAADRKNLSFQSDIQIGVERDLVVVGDPGRVRQILTNLLTNSIKFTSEGYVKLSAVVKNETSETIEILFSVQDTGIGIEEEVRKRLFKPFSQADSSTARRFGGTGLGLTICKNLVDLMHGEITLDSVLGTGTKATFSIVFNKPQFSSNSPLIDLGSIPDRLHSEMSVSGCGSDRERTGGTPPQSPLDGLSVKRHNYREGVIPTTPVQNPLDPESTLSEAERKKTHVLIVEDNAINQQIAIKTIKKLHFSVNAVWNGKEALDYLLETPSPKHPKPDVILMDVQMPILDGYRATHLIRHHKPYLNLPGMRSTPIVAMTASAIQGDREKCRNAGMDDYLAKPVKAATLERMLVKWAIESKKMGLANRGCGSQHTDHDSSCTDIDAEPELTSSPTPNHLHPNNEMPKITTNSRARALAASTTFPTAESEGDRGLRRVAAEEKATALRDSKLLAASEVSDAPTERPLRSSPPLPGSNPPLAALTEENVGKLGGRQQGKKSASQTRRAASRTPDAGSSSESLAPVGGDSSPGSTVGSLKTLEQGRNRGGKMNRSDSDRSGRTVTLRNTR